MHIQRCMEDALHVEQVRVLDEICIRFLCLLSSCWRVGPLSDVHGSHVALAGNTGDVIVSFGDRRHTSYSEMFDGPLSSMCMCQEDIGD